jgi:hypothetical protein
MNGTDDESDDQMKCKPNPTNPSKGEEANNFTPGEVQWQLTRLHPSPRLTDQNNIRLSSKRVAVLAQMKMVNYPSDPSRSSVLFGQKKRKGISSGKDALSCAFALKSLCCFSQVPRLNVLPLPES